MKGHKPGCKCVGCSPATRRRGQAALEATRGGKPARKNPAAKADPPKRTAKKKPAARRNPAPSVVVVSQPAPAPAPRPRRKPARKNPAPAPAPAPARREASRPHPHLPAELAAGRYVVLTTERGDGGRLRPIKVFSRVAEATAFARELPAGSKAVVAEVRTVWG